MTEPAPGTRSAERRAAWLGFAILMAVIAGHTVLETARDTLFLRDLPATRLPWAYLMMAGASFVLALVSGVGFGLSRRRALQMTLVGGAVVTLAFSAVVGQPTLAILLGLYVWTGLLVSLAVMHVWLFLSEQVDLAQAKRTYTIVAAGGLAGAAVGGLVAAGVLRVLPAGALLPVSSVLYLLAALIPSVVRSAPAIPLPEQSETAPGIVALLRADPYVRRLVAVSLVPPLVFTGIDYVWKSAVSANVAAADLGHFFAQYNAAVYTLALLVHLLLASRLLRALGVIRGLMTMPALVLPGAAVFAATGTFAIALGLKAADVTFRHSLYRASTEILFLPIGPRLRAAAKAAADGLAQRSGQALASLALLLAAGQGLEVVSAGLAVLCVAWFVALVGLRTRYVSRFRAQLGELHDSHAGIPELDLYALEALVGALASPRDAEVIAALDMLADYDRTRLVSPLILYHPSPAVVRRALALFDDSPRDDVRLIHQRLLAHDDPQIRAAALRSRAARELETDRLWDIVRNDASPEVRGTALAMALARQADAAANLEPDVEGTVRDILAAWPTARAALAEALPTLPRLVAIHLAHALADGADAGVRRALAHAAVTLADASLVGLCIGLLDTLESREPARQALVALGDPALAALADALVDPTIPDRVRLHLPRSISRFGNATAVRVLADALPGERDPRVRHKMLRALGRLRADDPALPVERAPLITEATDALERAVASLAYGVAYAYRARAEGAALRPDDLLAELLREKERRALERVFRILQILEPAEEYRGMFSGLTRTDPHLRAASRELLEHVATEPALRDALLVMTEPAAPLERLTRALALVELPDATRLVALVTRASENGGLERARGELLDVTNRVLAPLATDRDPVLAAVAAHELGTTTPVGPEAAHADHPGT